MIQGKKSVKQALTLFWIIAAVFVGGFLVMKVNESQDITSRASRDTDVLPGDDILSLQKDMENLTDLDSLSTMTESDLDVSTE